MGEIAGRDPHSDGSTGVYRKPIWNVLEGGFELLLVNAAHIKNVAGRKTDMRDCEWIAQLLQHGLLRGSFVPIRPCCPPRAPQRGERRGRKEVGDGGAERAAPASARWCDTPRKSSKLTAAWNLGLRQHLFRGVFWQI